MLNKLYKDKLYNLYIYIDMDISLNLIKNHPENEVDTVNNSNGDNIFKPLYFWFCSNPSKCIPMVVLDTMVREDGENASPFLKQICQEWRETLLNGEDDE